MRFRIQKAIALITIGAITFGILHGYSEFYEQVITKYLNFLYIYMIINLKKRL